MAREPKKQSGRVNWRLTFGILVVGAIAVSTAMAGYKASLYVASDQQFRLSHDHKDALTITGVTYASRWKVQRIFAADFDRSVFSVPLDERRRRLLAIDWVEDASVSRIWPDRLIVRIRERKPVAFVSFRSGTAVEVGGEHAENLGADRETLPFDGQSVGPFRGEREGGGRAGVVAHLVSRHRGGRADKHHHDRDRPIAPS